MSEPAYVAIAREYVHRIQNGELSPGAQLPSFAEIAREYGVSDIVVRRAVDLLDGEGYVRRVQRRGVFVKEQLGARNQRISINVDPPLAAWLQSEASSATNGNVPAYLEDLIRREALRESLNSHADFFAARPGWFDDLEAEHEAAWRSGE